MHAHAVRARWACTRAPGRACWRMRDAPAAREEENEDRCLWARSVNLQQGPVDAQRVCWQPPYAWRLWWTLMRGGRKDPAGRSTVMRTPWHCSEKMRTTMGWDLTFFKLPYGTARVGQSRWKLFR